MTVLLTKKTVLGCCTVNFGTDRVFQKNGLRFGAQEQTKPWQPNTSDPDSVMSFISQPLRSAKINTKKDRPTLYCFSADDLQLDLRLLAYRAVTCQDGERRRIRHSCRTNLFFSLSRREHEPRRTS